MQVTCKICKKKLEKEDAYLHVHYTKTGNKQNQYFCSFDEWERTEKEKEFYKECQYKIDDLMGYEVVNNARNKMLSDLNKSGYSYEKIYNCINDNCKTIENALILKRNDLENEYNTLAYMFGIIKKEISKYGSKTNDKKINSDTLDPSEIYKSKRKVKQEKKSLFQKIKEAKNGDTKD